MHLGVREGSTYVFLCCLQMCLQGRCVLHLETQRLQSTRCTHASVNNMQYTSRRTILVCEPRAWTVVNSALVSSALVAAISGGHQKEVLPATVAAISGRVQQQRMLHYPAVWLQSTWPCCCQVNIEH
jgi:hypothetical protein